ncbi:eukaryotic rRNA processing protein EBP2-domain-containing protein [Favolaschia claudopus]|uniref:Eukaryotic rRNA processing protein EBP2-domain-containing protein n=1 Tax=Favolaschia claudopus TaxID=2862362 RepID=A0AAW0D8N3_9AGAR
MPPKITKSSTTPAKTLKEKPVAGPSKTKPKDSEVIPVPATASDDEEADDASESDEDSDDDGVDEVGMERLMNALGDDGLDEYEQMQLHLALGGEADGDEDDDEEDTSDEEFTLEKAGAKGSDAENSDSDDAEEDEEFDDEEDEGEEDGEEGEDVALEDVESVDDDAVPKQKIEIDNTVALARIRETIQLDPSLPWTETLVLTYPDAIEVDVEDDLNRELAFYKQALHGATTARTLAAKHNLPFTRPADYFAEMVKSDAHMERIRQRLLDETAGIKKSEDKRKEREGKKFGKQVQIEKLKEREKGKKEMEERLRGLKRKRGDMLDKPAGGDDDFDIAVEDAISDRPAKRGRGAAPGGRGRGAGKVSRDARNQKFGFGGAGKRSKSNTRESTDDFGGGKRGGGFGGRGGRGGRGGGRGGFGGGRGGGSKRPGKDKRIAAKSRR